MVIKGILKVLFSFIPWLFNFSVLPNYGWNTRKRYTLRLLSKCLVRSTLIKKLAPDFKNHMRNLDNFRQAVERPKSWNSMGYICLKTIFLHLKHYLQIYLTFLSADLWFAKWHEEYGKFFPGHLKLGFWWDPLIQNWKSMSPKSTEDLSFMTMKNYAKFEKELTRHFKVDMRNLMNFNPSTRKSQKFSF